MHNNIILDRATQLSLGGGGGGGGPTDVLPTMAYIEKLLLKGYLFFCKGKEIHDLNR